MEDGMDEEVIEALRQRELRRKEQPMSLEEKLAQQRQAAAEDKPVFMTKSERERLEAIRQAALAYDAQMQQKHSDHLMQSWSTLKLSVAAGGGVSVGFEPPKAAFRQPRLPKRLTEPLSLSFDCGGELDKYDTMYLTEQVRCNP